MSKIDEVRSQIGELKSQLRQMETVMDSLQEVVDDLDVVDGSFEVVEEKWVVPTDEDAAQKPRIKCRYRYRIDDDWECGTLVAVNNNRGVFIDRDGDAGTSVRCEIRESDRAKPVAELVIVHDGFIQSALYRDGVKVPLSPAEELSSVLVRESKGLPIRIRSVLSDGWSSRNGWPLNLSEIPLK